VTRVLRDLISTRTAGYILLAALCLLAMFHLLVLVRVVPMTLVWGGRAVDAPVNPLLLEVVSLVVTLLFCLVVVARIGQFRSAALQTAGRYCIWLVFIYFTFNIVGNLVSLSSLESLIFTPVSVVLAILALRLAIER
jgi:hypothetical protein